MSPSIPRLPLVPDPFRRIRLPEDLEVATVIGAEEEPEAGGMDAEAIERIWNAALGLYRSGVHPALQICLRRNGHVVLDRAIGHARGNGPRDGGEAERVPVGTETPFCIFSTSKAVTALVIHTLADRGACPSSTA